MCKIYHKQVLVCQVFSFIFWILGLKMALESGLKNSAETSYTAPNRWIRDTSAMPMTVVLPPPYLFYGNRRQRQDMAIFKLSAIRRNAPRLLRPTRAGRAS